jgi:hypothetical protein
MDFRSLLFWRKPPIADLDALADFIDERAAFVVQKGIYEYSRARAGHYAKVMFSEKTFLDAVEVSRWSAYPLGLAMVTELAEGILLPYAPAARERQLAQLSRLVLSVYDRYAIPEAINAEAWLGARAELARRLQLIGLHPPKSALDVPKPFVKAYFDLMPIHAELRATDYPTTRSYLKIVMCNVHDEFARRMDAPRISRLLLDEAGDAPHSPAPSATDATGLRPDA